MYTETDRTAVKNTVTNALCIFVIDIENISTYLA